MSFNILAPSLFNWRPSSLNSCLWPQKILKLLMKLTPFMPQDRCSHVFSPSSHENMFVSLAGSGPQMNKSLKCFKEFGEILLKEF